MTSAECGERGRGRASRTRWILIYHNNRNNKSMCECDHDGEHETTDAFHQPVIPTPFKGARKL